MVGDWTGTGISKIGIFRSGYYWVLDANGNCTFDGTGTGQDYAFAYGQPGTDVPVVGDWLGTGVSNVGVFRNGYYWILDSNGNHQYDKTDTQFPFGGLPMDVPVVGKWGGAGQPAAQNTGWGAPVLLRDPVNQTEVSDVNLAWDSYRHRFVVAAFNDSTSQIFFGYYDSAGIHWTQTPPFDNRHGQWDYPSIGVDAAGHIIIGADNIGVGYYAVVSTDGGATFSPPLQIGTQRSDYSRVVATDNQFYAFVTTFDAGTSLPIGIKLYQSGDGISWNPRVGIDGTLASFTTMNATPGPPPGQGNFPTLYYAPQLAASGYTNGKWAVVIPINFAYNNVAYANVYMCTSDRGCGVVNAFADDQFLAGVSVSGDGGYWVSYLTYDPNYGIRSTNPRLMTQTIYFAPGANAIGATTNTGINPSTWIPQAGYRCKGNFFECYAAGDFNTVASNPFALATTPYVAQSSHQTDLFQSFVQDPQVQANVPNFIPNFIPFPVGTDLRRFALPFLANDPASNGVPPGLRIGAH